MNKKQDEQVVLTEDLPGGAYRKAIYQCIQETIGRNLSDQEHKYISGILKLYVDAHVKRVEQYLPKNEPNKKTV